jgi:hypothetical protein
MERILVEQEELNYVARIILEEDENGNSVREFFAPGASEQEALAILTHTINASSVENKEYLIELVKKEIENKNTVEQEPSKVLERAANPTKASASAPKTTRRNQKGKRQ